MPDSPLAHLPKIHVIYEYGVDFRPHASSFIRLLRPLSHPTARTWARFSFGREYIPPGTDLVIVDRLWRPDISLQLAEKLLTQIHQTGAKFIYSLDDNLLDLPLERLDWPRPEHLAIIRYWLGQADGVMVSTPQLQERLQYYNPRISTIPNALDEQLLIPRPVSPDEQVNHRLVIGYMGTQTHDEDFRLILPAVRSVLKRHAGRVILELIGVTSSPETLALANDLPIRWLSPDSYGTEYPFFMLWFTGQVYWDIALAPLRDSVFTRSKSDIKFLDYAAIAAPGIFSQHPAYATSIQPLQNGLLVDNTPEAWESAIESLLADPQLRFQMTSQAIQDLYRQRILSQSGGNWKDALSTFF